MGKKGFTLIELILVITILGILAVSALPKFVELTGKAKEAARDGVVGAVRSGIALYRANDMVTAGSAGVYPASLDANATGTACVTCFSQIFTTGLNDASWTKASGTAYTFNDGTNTKTYTYNSTTGEFH